MLIAQQAHYVATPRTNPPDRRRACRRRDRASARRRPAQARADARSYPHARTARTAACRARRARHQALPRPRARRRQPNLRTLRDAGIIEHHGRGEWRIFDPLLRRYLQQLPGEARPHLNRQSRHAAGRATNGRTPNGRAEATLDAGTSRGRVNSASRHFSFQCSPRASTEATLLPRTADLAQPGA